MRRSELFRRTPIKRVNKGRKARLREQQWGPPGWVQFVKSQRCCACHGPYPEAAHEPSRGAGGTWKDIVPLCAHCHRTRPGAIHQIGRRLFEEKNNLDLEEVKARLLDKWDTTRGRDERTGRDSAQRKADGIS